MSHKKYKILFFIVAISLFLGGIYLKEPDMFRRVGSFVCTSCIGL